MARIPTTHILFLLLPLLSITVAQQPAQLPQAAHKIYIKNKGDLAYTLQVNISVRNEPYELALDSTISTPWFTDMSCPRCGRKKINCDEPLFFFCGYESKEERQLMTAIANITGLPSKITFTMDELDNIDIKELPVLSITQRSRLIFPRIGGFNYYKQANIDGVVGFAPLNGNMPPFLEQIFTIKNIKAENKVVSLLLNGFFDDFIPTSEIALGGYNPNVTKLSSIFWVNNIDQTPSANSWTLKLDGLSFENASISLEANRVILSTANPFIVLPHQSFITFLDVLNKLYKVSCEDNDAYRSEEETFTCNGSLDFASLPSLKVKLAGGEVEIPARKYFIRNQLLLIPGEDDGSVVLGLPFFRTVYTVLDYNNLRVGFGKWDASMIPRPSPVRKPKAASTSWMKYFVLILPLIALIFVLWIFKKYYGQELKKTNNINDLLITSKKSTQY